MSRRISGEIAAGHNNDVPPRVFNAGRAADEWHSQMIDSAAVFRFAEI